MVTRICFLVFFRRLTLFLYTVLNFLHLLAFFWTFIRLLNWIWLCYWTLNWISQLDILAFLPDLIMSDNELVWAPSSDKAEPSADMEELPLDVAESSTDPLAADFQHDGIYTNRRLYVSENLNMWSFKDIFTKLGTHQQCLAFSEQQGLILKEKMCPKHRTLMKISYSYGSKVFGSFRCRKGKCDKAYSRRQGTFFDKTVLDIVHVYYLIYAYSRGWTYDNVIFEDPYKNIKLSCLSRKTIADWFNYCREVVITYYLEKQNTFSGKIGGPAKIVHIDKSKFGEWKYRKGKYNEGHWVLGLIEDGSEDLRLEVCPENISSDVIISLIQKHVEVGTTIHTDGWQAYDCLSDHGYIHNKPNHSDPDNPNSTVDHRHMQNFRSQWRVAKRFLKLKNCNDENFMDLLIEFLWRRNIKKYKKDGFLELISAVKHVYKVV